MSTGMGRILGHAHRLSRYSRHASTFSATGSRSFRYNSTATASRSFSARPTIHSKLDNLTVEMGNILNVQKKMNVLVDSKILLLLEIQKMLSVQRELGEKLNLQMNMLVDSKILLLLEIQKMLYVQRELGEKLNLHSESPGQIQLLFEKANEPKNWIIKVKDSPTWSGLSILISLLAFAKFLDLEGKVNKFINKAQEEEEKESAIGEGMDLADVSEQSANGERMTRNYQVDVSNQSAIGEGMTRKDHADVSNQSANGEGMTRKDHVDVSDQSAIGEGMSRKDHADVSNQSANGEGMTRKDHADVSNQSAIEEGMSRKDHADVSNQD